MANENVPFTLHEVEQFNPAAPSKFSIVRMGPVAYITAPREVAQLVCDLLNANKADADACMDAAYLRSTSN